MPATRTDASSTTADAAFAQRRTRLRDPHMVALRRHRAALLRAHPGAFVPYFDPDDGGVDARVLLLLESPGPAAFATGFTSLDNPSQSSKNLKACVMQVGLRRKQVLMWNLLPTNNGVTVTKPTAAGVRAGVVALMRLLDALPDLRVVVTLGATASAAAPAISRWNPEIKVIPCPHPSPLRLNRDSEARGMLVAGLRKARRFADA